VFLAIWRLFGRRKRILIGYWVLSAALVLAAGGLTAVLAFLAVLLFRAVVAVVGDGLARLLFDEADRNWGASLGLGILAAAVLGAYLAAFHLFTAWGVAVALSLGVGLSWWLGGFGRSARSTDANSLRSDMRPVPLADRLGLLASEAGGALALEVAFLLGVFAWVGASAPEGRTDALRVYWPFVRLLDHFHGFFNLPYQWSFIAPQAGVTYAGSLFVSFGSRSVRYAMLLALTALVAMIWNSPLSRRGDDGVRATASSGSATVAILAASCPLILGMSLSLMQDTFVSLAVFLLALLCLEGRDPGSLRFWIGAGALCALALTAKYTTIAYAAPLIAWAACRSFREEGIARTIKGLIIMEGAALVVAGPWLWQAYRQSGDPFFPFLTTIFPAPLWPFGLGAPSLGRLHMVAGSRQWVTWPSEGAAGSGRLAELSMGNLGIAVPLLLMLACFACFGARRRAATPWISCAVVGTLLLWTQTGYARYWLPGIWLLAVPAAAAAADLAKGARSQVLCAAAAFFVLALQLPMEMSHAWFDPKGWPWDFYSGSLSEEGYFRRFPGFDAFRRLDAAAGERWPKVWCTGILQMGNARVIPLQAAEWEMHLHGGFATEAAAKFLRSAGCEYWVVDRRSPAGDFFRKLGLDEEFWTPERLFASDGGIAIYRMR
jgi:hypothetical protein